MNKCVICGRGATQAPVCFDLRCQRTYNSRYQDPVVWARMDWDVNA